MFRNYNYYTDTVMNVSNGSVVECDMTFIDSSLRGKSYSVLQATEYASDYVNKMEGKYLPQIPIAFPALDFEGTCYSSFFNQMFILCDDYCDWDVIMHEYGHYVEDKFGFESGNGGEHSSDEVLTDKLKSKKKGIHLAWNEGWATYFSISCQKYLSLSNLNVLDEDRNNTIGNDNYDDTIDQKIIEDLKVRRRQGEGNEHTIAGFILSLADFEKRSYDVFSYGYQNMWDIVIDNKVNNLSDFCQLLHSSYSYDLNLIGALETYFNISASLSYSTPAKYSFQNYTFLWSVFNANSNFCLNNFNLKFYNNSGRNYFSINNISQTSYTPFFDEWKIILSGSKQYFYWSVECYATNELKTGTFISEFHKVTMPSVLEINQTEYGYEPQYFFYEKRNTINKNDLIINTKRLRTGFIENEYIVLSPRRQDAGKAYLEFSLNKKIGAISLDLAFWSNNEGLSKHNGTCYLQYKNESGEWVNHVDLLNDYNLPTDRNKPMTITAYFEKPVQDVRIVSTSIYPTGTRNKGRICLGKTKFYISE